MSFPAEWNLVDVFTIGQAAYLWHELDPPAGEVRERYQGRPPAVAAVMQALMGALAAKNIVGEWHDPVAEIRKDPFRVSVSRADLISFAKLKNVYPAFLFDTVAPPHTNPPVTLAGQSVSTGRGLVDVQGSTDRDGTVSSRKRGRPEGYDWNACVGEIVRLADMDGLPVTQAELLRHLQGWFIDQFDDCPSDSVLKSRISSIYQYLEKIGWKSNRS